MYLTQREKAEDLEQFKKAADRIWERAQKDPEYARQFLRDIGVGTPTESSEAAKPKKKNAASRTSPKKRA
jgi:hypothetical protein